MTSPNFQLGIPDPEWVKFYNQDPDRVPQLVGSPSQLRNIMMELKTKAASMVPEINEGICVKDVQITVSDGECIYVRVYTPSGGTGHLPGLVYIHGGGWTLGDLEGEDIACRAICVGSQVVVVSIDYRLAPENPFPKGLEDSWGGLLWTIHNASMLGIDSKKIILAGSSSGGNTASEILKRNLPSSRTILIFSLKTAVLAHRARDQGIALKGQILRIPATCHMDCYPSELQLFSMEELKNAPLLCKKSMELFYGYYNPPDPSSPEVSPLLNTDFKGLAPAYLQIAGMDPLRDEGLAYAEKLKNAGVTTKVDIYPGLPHAFGYFPELSAASKVGEDLLVSITNLANGI